MQMTKEQLAELVKTTVEPLVQGMEAKMALSRTEMEAVIKAAVAASVPAQPTADRPRFEGGAERVGEDPKGGFKSISHFARDVYLNAKSGGNKFTKELDSWQKAADATSLVEGDSEFGGFLIPTEFRNELWLAVQQENPLLPLCMQVPMATTTIKIPYVNGFDESGGLVYGGIQWYWADELDSGTPNRPKVGRVTMTLHKLFGLAYASDEILEDSPVSMENLLKNGFKDGLNFQIMKALIRGTGAGQPLGIINAPCLVTVSKEALQGVDTVVSQGDAAWSNPC